MRWLRKFLRHWPERYTHRTAERIFAYSYFVERTKP